MSVAKATAAMTAPATPTNMEVQRKGFFDQCAQFGTNAGAGDTSKVGWFQSMTDAAWQGVIAPAGRRKKGDINTPLTDPELAYKAFADARQKKAGELGKKLGDVARGKGDYNVRVSEANRMITLGSLPIIHDTNMGGLGVFNRALKIIRDVDEITGEVDDLLLDVARRQCEAPDTPLTNDQIKAILMPDEEKKPKKQPEIKLWRGVQRAIGAIMDRKYPKTAGENSYAKTALQSVTRRIEELEADTNKPPARQVKRQGARKGKRA